VIDVGFLSEFLDSREKIYARVYKDVCKLRRYTFPLVNLQLRKSDLTLQRVSLTAVSDILEARDSLGYTTEVEWSDIWAIGVKQDAWQTLD
jgi:hypothetical protein